MYFGHVAHSLAQMRLETLPCQTVASLPNGRAAGGLGAQREDRAAGKVRYSIFPASMGQSQSQAADQPPEPQLSQEERSQMQAEVTFMIAQPMLHC